MLRQEEVFPTEKKLYRRLEIIQHNFLPSRIRNSAAPIIESVPHLHKSPVPYGTALLGGAVPGTSCQATIAPSLPDISQQALASVPKIAGTLPEVSWLFFK